MDYTTLPTLIPAFTDLESFPMHSLYEALQGLADPRRGQGKRYSMALVLCVIILAKVAGQTTLSGATEWVRHRRMVLVERFGLTRSTMPCQMTYCNVLALVDGTHFDALLSAFFAWWEAQSRCGDEPSRLQTLEGKAHHRHLAIDGKALRATNKTAHSVHQLRCYEVSTGRVLWHCTVQDKHHEISALKPLLTIETVKGRILSLDALHTQRKLCAQVTRLGETMS